MFRPAAFVASVASAVSVCTRASVSVAESVH